MIEPSENYKGGTATLTAEELGLFIGLFDSAKCAESYLSDSQRRLSNLSDSIAALEDEVE